MGGVGCRFGGGFRGRRGMSCLIGWLDYPTMNGAIDKALPFSFNRVFG